MREGKSTTTGQIASLLQQALLYYKQGQLAEAGMRARQILDLDPNHEKATYLLGFISGKSGRHDAAARLFARAVKSKPRRPDYHYNLGFSLQSGGHLKPALAAYQQVIKLDRRHAEAHNKCGDIFSNLGRLDDALAAYEKAIKLKPTHYVAYNNRGNILLELGYLHQALASYERAILLKPDQAITYNNCGNALRDLGRIEEAENNYRRALRLRPDYATAHSNLLFHLAAHARLSPEMILDEHQRWDTAHGKKGRTHALASNFESVGQERRLRVGYVSPNFRNNVVSYFIEPVLAAHDQTRFEIFCYASHPESLSDTTTERLRSISEHWRYVDEMADEQLASLIHNDGIDILVDLAGHTSKNRLRAFTYRPARVQVTYLGYFAGTGLESIDYWITDNVLHPPETVEQSVEIKYRLPRCWVCYTPPAEAPDVASCPSQGSQVVFGSFSNLSKLTAEVIETWSEILMALPGSRLLLMAKQFVEPESRENLIQRFEHQGVTPERLLIRKGTSLRKYLATYAEVDIVLDPFPRTGGTTTAESLWMGVPVVTLAGRCYVERISASKLEAVGLDDLVSHSRKGYIATALSLAYDYTRRAELRTSMRAIMRESPLCDNKSLARSLEDAYLSIIERTSRI